MRLPEYLTHAIDKAIQTESTLKVPLEKHRAASRTLREAVADHSLALAHALDGTEADRGLLEQLYEETSGLGPPQIVEACGLRSTTDRLRMIA